jgi:hypothetical protein
MVEYFEFLKRLDVKNSHINLQCKKGAAVGFACTSLALYDFVFSEASTLFKTPFMPLGLCVEGIELFFKESFC